MLTLPKFSIGVGDRFALEAKPQLRACQNAWAQGVLVAPVWNKSHREHGIVGSQPASVRAAARAAVQELGWKGPWFTDADHISLKTVEDYLESHDFFTIDVADRIGQPAEPGDVAAFVKRHPELAQEISIVGLEHSIQGSASQVERVAAKYLAAVKEAGRIQRFIAARRGAETFVTEVSMDETDSPQTPDELLIILAALADENIPLQTIAPKFTGRFNKGVDYVGDLGQFEREFRADLAVTRHASKAYGLPASLKLSVHSGSDKFSLYPIMRKALADSGAGLHLKTAGTTWLEELIGLAEHGGEGLALAKEVYGEALAHQEELCAPYASVIDIDPAKLPSAEVVDAWSSSLFVDALRHDPLCPRYNAHLRQLLHVGYKVAARMGDRYLGMLGTCRAAVKANVERNLWERHVRPLFIG